MLPIMFGKSEKEINNIVRNIKSEYLKWYNKTNHNSEYIFSHDNLILHAYNIENSKASNKYAILCHGYSAEGIYMFGTGQKFYDEGYNILIPDARGHGSSSGEYIGMGWIDRLDIIKWIDEIVSKDKEAKIVLYGISMGGSTVMNVSGEELPSNVVAIIEDSGYSSIWEEFSYQLDELFNLPEFPVLHFANVVTKIKAQYFLKEAKTKEQVAKSKTPMMFIHGDSDTFVPSYMLDELYEIANEPKEKLIVEGAGHAEASNILGEEYWNRIFTFIDKYI